jgi:putative glutamine amidotransferase
MQKITVALGGRLLADVARADLHGARHADPNRYDRHRHAVVLAPDGRLAALYGCTRGSVSSAHRQGVARLGDGLLIEATCPDDGLVEALRAGDGWVLGVQWHPEFLGDGDGELAGGRLFSDLVRAAAEAKEAAGR